MSAAAGQSAKSGFRLFLVYTASALIAGTAVASLFLSSFSSVLIDPSVVRTGLWLLYVFLLSFMFVTLPVVLSGLLATRKYMKSGYFRARYAALVAFVASGLVGPAYQNLYLGNSPDSTGILKSLLWACLIIGPVAAVCAFVGQRTVRYLGYMKMPDAEMAG